MENELKKILNTIYQEEKKLSIEEYMNLNRGIYINPLRICGIKYIKENIDFAIYNLGYLPKGDKYITTNAKDVEESLKKLLEKLNSKGAIFITFYIGHSAGQIESLEISKFLQNLNQKEYTILKCTFENQKNNPPYVVMIQKI